MIQQKMKLMQLVMAYTLGHDFIVNRLISTSIGLGYSDSDAKVDAGNDAETLILVSV